jgi:site-specific DNA-methyltransferase (cytosine-N4-specific)
VVLDIFAGSNTTGAVSESLCRKWLAFELERSYLAASAFRFLDVVNEPIVKSLYKNLMTEGKDRIIVSRRLELTA